jgi:hypothetical protein
LSFNLNSLSSLFSLVHFAAAGTYAHNLQSGSDKTSITDPSMWDEWFAGYFDFINLNSDIDAVAYISADWQSQPMWGSGNQGYWGNSAIGANSYIKGKWEDAMRSVR